MQLNKKKKADVGLVQKMTCKYHRIEGIWAHIFIWIKMELLLQPWMQHENLESQCS